MSLEKKIHTHKCLGLRRLKKLAERFGRFLICYQNCSEIFHLSRNYVYLTLFTFQIFWWKCSRGVRLKQTHGTFKDKNLTKTSTLDTQYIKQRSAINKQWSIKTIISYLNFNSSEKKMIIFLLLPVKLCSSCLQVNIKQILTKICLV